MSDQINRCRFTSDTTGTGSSIHFVAAASTAYLTPSEAGIVDGHKYTYVITMGNDFEVQQDQAWTASGSTIARGTPIVSKISGTAGTTKLTLDNTAVITFGASALDLMFANTRGTDVASASTVDMQSVQGGVVDVTGTTTVTAVTLQDGATRLVRFAGALTLTNGSSLLLPGAANITTAAGDFATFRGYAAGVVRCTHYQRLSGAPIGETATGLALRTAASAQAAQTALALTLSGQCQLVKNGSNLELQRYGGKYLFINGALEVVPSSPITLAPTSLSVSTLYYVYAYMNSGTMTLEASATAHAIDSTYGHRIKSGDATRSLVGMAYTIAGPAWSDLATQRFVLSYFNRRARSSRNGETTDRSTVNGTYAELPSTARAEFLTWADETVILTGSGTCYNDTAGSTTAIQLYLDGAAADLQDAEFTSTSGSAGGSFSLDFSGDMSEGYHYVNFQIKRLTSGTAHVINAFKSALVRG